MATSKGHIYQVQNNILSKNPIDEEGSEEIEFNRKGEITNLTFAGIEKQTN